MSKGNIALLLGVLIGIPVIYKLVMWLIVDYQLPPEIFTILIVYIVLVYPQYTAQHGLRMVEAMQDEDGEDDYLYVKPKKSNWLLFFNDYELSSYFGTDNIVKLIVTWLLRLSIPLFILSALYVNLLVVFIDFGATFALVAMYTQLIALIVYIITKSIIVGYFLNMFKGPMASIMGLFYPIGLMVTTFAIKQYLTNLEEVQSEDRYGMGYE